MNDIALKNLVKDLSSIENIPTDSESLEICFHSHGVNMRYLGKVYDLFKDLKFSHIKYMLEKEIFLRGIKHIMNSYMKECNESYDATVAAHLLNLIFSPP